GGARLDAKAQVVGPCRDDGEAGGGGTGKAVGAALAQGIAAGRVQDQVAEGGDAGIDGNRGGTSAREAAGAARDGERHLVGVVVAVEVAELVEQLHRHPGTDALPGYGGARLDAEAQVVGPCRDDGEARGTRAGDAAGAALAQGVSARRV